MDKQQREREATIEARRQLIWASRREGYLMAVRDLSKALTMFKAAFDSMLKTLQQMEADQGDLAP